VSYLVYIARGPRGALRIGRASKRPGPEGQEAPKRADPSLRLVYYEFFQTLGDAIVRERQLKTWERRWKVELIETVNPRWDDLSGRLMA
jgi:predicted GIY-YIG superfamily endonuclease